MEGHAGCHGNSVALTSEREESVSCRFAFMPTYIPKRGGGSLRPGWLSCSSLANVASLPHPHARRWDPVIGKYSLRHDTGERVRPVLRL